MVPDVTPYFTEGGITLYVGDCLEVLPQLPSESVDAIVTDPPYALTNRVADVPACDTCGRQCGGKEGTAERVKVGDPCPRCGAALVSRRTMTGAGFMGKDWDTGLVAFSPETWREVLRVAKPGAHLLAFGGTRTSHRLVCAIEDAGWEIRDTLMWVYGSGFPKSLDVSKAIDKEAGAARPILGVNEDYLRRKPNGMKTAGATAYNYSQQQHETDANVTAPATEAAKQWDGWGTALKPAVEPIVLARKPLIGTVAANVQRYGTGALNIGASRIGAASGDYDHPGNANEVDSSGTGWGTIRSGRQIPPHPVGRWPANLIHDGSPEVVECFPETESNPGTARTNHAAGIFGIETKAGRVLSEGNGGNASRFFYCAKASRADRYSEAGNDHPTVKPLALIQYLIRLITPPGGVVLDPFSGSGTTPKAARDLAFKCIAIDLEERHQEIAKHRLNQTVLDFGGAA